MIMKDPLEDMPIEERNTILDRIQAEIDFNEARAEMAAELANEQIWLGVW